MYRIARIRIYKLQWLHNVGWNEWLYSSHTMYRMAMNTPELWLLNCKDTWIRETYAFYVTKTYEMKSCIINLRLLHSWDVDFHGKIATLRVLSCLELAKAQFYKPYNLINITLEETYSLRNLKLCKLCETWETLQLEKHAIRQTYNFRNIKFDKLRTS